MISMQARLDRLMELASRSVARRSSRRSFLGTFAMAITGVAALPLLPVRRGAVAEAADLPAKDAPAAPQAGHAKAPATIVTDQQSCDYWKYCAIDGFLCSCCGGTSTTCPPGTEPSPITWIGTCQNPADGRDYLVSYNDCCGRTTCGACTCVRNEGEKPMYRMSLNNDVNWCMANDNPNYHCSVSVILGVAEK